MKPLEHSKSAEDERARLWAEIHRVENAGRSADDLRELDSEEFSVTLGDPAEWRDDIETEPTAAEAWTLEYQAWAKGREALASSTPDAPASDWQDSDDEAVNLLHRAFPLVTR